MEFFFVFLTFFLGWMFMTCLGAYMGMGGKTDWLAECVTGIVAGLIFALLTVSL